MSDERQRAYYRIADAAIDYIATCAKFGIVPLEHDARLYRMRLNKVRVTGKEER